MINNRISSLVYRSIFITFSFIGIFLSSRILEGVFNTHLFVYYTHLSNILCFVVMLIVLIKNFKHVNNNETTGHNEAIKRVKGAATIAILITGVVYHFLLGDPSEADFFTLDNIIVHYIVPFMFVLDWILFDKKKSYSVIDPVSWLAVPGVYFVYALIRGAIVGTSNSLQYAYFFIDVNIYGYGGVMIWAIALAAAFLIVGYLMWLIDKIVKVDGKIKLDFSKEDISKEG